MCNWRWRRRDAHGAAAAGRREAPNNSDASRANRAQKHGQAALFQQVPMVDPVALSRRIGPQATVGAA